MCARTFWWRDRGAGFRGQLSDFISGRTRTRTLDPLIKSQLVQLKYQRLARKLIAFPSITDQSVTIQMQTANRTPARTAMPTEAADSQVSCAIATPSIPF